MTAGQREFSYQATWFLGAIGIYLAAQRWGWDGVGLFLLMASWVTLMRAISLYTNWQDKCSKHYIPDVPVSWGTWALYWAVVLLGITGIYQLVQRNGWDDGVKWMLYLAWIVFVGAFLFNRPATMRQAKYQQNVACWRQRRGYYARTVPKV